MIKKARESSPEAFLRGHYPDVKVTKDGSSITVEGILRADKKGDHWVSCDWHGGGIGDNVALVQYLAPGTSFPESVFTLVGRGGERIAVAQKQEEAGPKFPRVPYSKPIDQRAGREYLEGRGISLSTIQAAEQAGFLRYCNNGIIYLGWDQERRIRSATIRHIVPTVFGDGETLTKRDLSGSSKLHPGILPGDPRRVVVTEGGTNALAVQDLARLRGQPIPTVISTGGAGVRKWVHDNPQARAIIEGAESVIIASERERDRDGMPDSEKQQRTDVMREHLARVITQVREGEVPQIELPPEPHKDVAEWLLDELKKQHDARLRDDYEHDRRNDY